MRTETCIGCGLIHRLVEARGIYFCPNPLCRATGAAWKPMTPEEAVERLRRVLRECRAEYHFVPNADDDAALELLAQIVHDLPREGKA